MHNVHVEWTNTSCAAPHHSDGQTYAAFESGFTTLQEAFDWCRNKYARSDLLVDGDRRFTFEQVFAKADVLATSMNALQRGDRVGVCGKNSVEWIVAFLAGVKAGMTVIPMNSWWTTHELEYAVRHSGVRIIFADVERLERLQKMTVPAKLSVKLVLLSPDFKDKHATHVLTLGRLETNEEKMPLAPASVKPNPDDAVLLMYTSGTTAFPKGVVLTNRGAAHTCTVFGHAAVSEAPQPGLKQLQKAILLQVPMFHATGLYAIFFSSLMIGRKVVIMSKWNAEHALMLIEKERVSHFTGVPTMVLELMSSPDLKKRDISSLKRVGSGGAPPPAGVANQIKKTLNSQPGQGYGLTEVNAVATSIGASDYLLRPTSAGRAVPGVTIQIWGDADGVALPPHQHGRIVIRGITVMREYFRDLEATKKAITKDGWFISGDFGHMDEEGFLFIGGRQSDLLIRGGENISAGTVEQSVYQHFPQIAECAVFGYPHAVLGEEVGLAIHMHNGQKAPTLKQIREKCGETISQFMLPTGIAVFEKSTLPRGATGKTTKRDIQKMLKEGLLESWLVWDKQAGKATKLAATAKTSKL